MKTSTVVWIAAAIIVIAGIGWYMFANTTPAVAPVTNTTTTQNPTGADTTPGAVKTVTVLYGPGGFSPSTVTVNVGDTVTFTDNGASPMWIASNPHPTHQGYDGTTNAQHCVAGYTGSVPFDQCAVGNTYSFMFTKAGTFGYHNHNNHADAGTVVVQ